MTRDSDFAIHACKAGGWQCGQFRDEARWTGHLAQHCTGCAEMFLSTEAGDKHVTYGADGRPICHDPATRTYRDGTPMFEKVPKPTWDPPYAWRRSRPNRPARPEARARAASVSAAASSGSPGTPDPEAVHETVTSRAVS